MSQHGRRNARLFVAEDKDWHDQHPTAYTEKTSGETYYASNSDENQKIDRRHDLISDFRFQILDFRFQIFQSAICNLQSAIPLFIPQGFNGIEQRSLAGRVESKKYSYNARKEK